MTFTFTMDAFPGKTYFNQTDEVLCAIQIVDDAKAAAEADRRPLFPHPTKFNIRESYKDSVNGKDVKTGDIEGDDKDPSWTDVD